MSELHSIEVGAARPYEVVCGPGACAAARDFATARDPGPGAAAVVADRRLFALHGDALAPFAHLPRLELEGGEGAKTLAVLGAVLEHLVSAGCSRRSCVYLIGGGSIGDVGGLAASLYKRGIDAVFLPTTLLAQVDASVGGKTAINLAGGKNLAGTFHDPLAVFADTALLSTLPDAELRSGLGEVVKTALVGGEDALARLEQRSRELAARDPRALADSVADCVRIKASVVAADPRERGPRRALNLGHTFAHAIELAAGFGTVPHGEAVAAGIGLALAASAGLGLLPDGSLRERFEALCAAFELPRDLADLRARTGLALPAAQLVAALAHDKKGDVGAPEFVLLAGAGDLRLGVRLNPSDLLA